MFADLGLGGLDTHNDNLLSPSNAYNSGFQKTSYTSNINNNYSNNYNNNNNRYNAGSSYNNVQNYGVPPLASNQSRMEADVAKKMIMAI